VVVIALGGNAIAREGRADPASQAAAVRGACAEIAALVEAGHRVVITHGNGPQVGNLLLKNDLARHVVPPVPLDWCVAQTQATLGYLIVCALESALGLLGIDAVVATVVTRVLVSDEDPAWGLPSKPVGQFYSASHARERVSAGGEEWREFGSRGWRRVVASPQPVEILDLRGVEQLIAAGSIVVAAGGGGIPMVRRDGDLVGVQAVIDKDLTGALLATALDADTLVIATDVRGAASDFGLPSQEWLDTVSLERLRGLLGDEHFAAGSMGPKVEAALRFVEDGGRRAVITSLDNVRAGLAGSAGTIVESARVAR
jgi:carbamate kinase